MASKARGTTNELYTHIYNMNKVLSFAAATLMLVACNNHGTAENTSAQDSANAVTETIMARRSIRHFTDQAVSRDTLMQLAEYGVNAPNARNLQEWAIRIVDDQEYLKGVTELMKVGMPLMVNQDDPKFRNGFRNATAVIFVGVPQDDESGMTLINAGAFCENVCLAAESMGLGSIVMGGPTMFISSTPDAKPFLDRLNLPEGYKLCICVGIGYPDEAPEAKPRDLGKIEFVK